MNKLFVTVGQITVGVIVGNVASYALDNLLVKPVKKVIKAKKKGL